MHGFEWLAGLHDERRRQPGVDGVLGIAYGTQDVSRSSCYLMGVLVEPELRSKVRNRLNDEHGIQTTVYPATHQLTAYVQTYGEVSLPLTERAASSLFSIPLFPHLTDEQ